MPAGDYEVGGHVLLPASDGVTVEADGARFSGNAIFLAVDSDGLTWNGGTFSGDGTADRRLFFNLFRTHDTVLSGLAFDRALAFGTHAFDLLGCEGVVIEGVTVTGYGSTVEQSGLSNHAKFAEAVQIDFAVSAGIGSPDTVALVRAAGGAFDGAPSTDVTVRRSTFEPSFDDAGEMTSWAPSPFGSHAYGAGGAQHRDVAFTENLVVDPLPAEALPDERLAGALHFTPVSGLEITGNSFASTGDHAQFAWVQLEQHDLDPLLPDGLTPGSSPTHGVRIAENTFSGPAPTAYVAIDARSEAAASTISDVLVHDNSFVDADAAAPVFNVRGITERTAGLVSDETDDTAHP